MIPEETVRSAMRRFGVPGVAVGLIHGDKEAIAGFGIASADNPLGVDGDTLFQIGSISKTFTAAAVMRLVETGRMDLNEPIRTYLPELRLSDEGVGAAVTMRHLLSHTGGWAGDYFDASNRGDNALEEAVSRLADLEQLTPLGEVWAYNNSAFYIAGRTVEILTGQPFEGALRDLVLDPLGLSRTYLFPEQVMTHRFAVGHDHAGTVMRPWALPRSSAPVGGLVMSVRELLRYARGHWTPGRILSAGSLDAMRRPAAPVGKPPGHGHPYFGEAVGLGWFLFKAGDHAFVTHSGSTHGQRSRLLIAPESRFALAVLTNHANGAALSNVLQDEVLRTVLGITPLPQHRRRLTPGQMREYAGRYVSRFWTADISVTDGGLVLRLTDNGGFPTVDSPRSGQWTTTHLEFESADAMIACDPPLEGERSEFLRNKNGEIQWYRLRGRLHKRTACSP